MNSEGRAQEARELLLEAHEKGLSNTQIRRITGVSMKTIQLWIERLPPEPRVKTVEALLLLGMGYYLPDIRREQIADPDKIDRLYTALARMRAEGHDDTDIARISGIGVEHIQRIARGPRRKYILPHTWDGVQRMEKHLGRKRGRKRARAAAD